MTEHTRRQIRAATLIWMISVAASRVAGLIRETVVARTAGATGLTDVFFVATTLPDFINYLLAGGSLSVTFIPIFTAFLVRGEEEEGWRVFSSTTTLIGLTLGSLLLAGWIFAAPLCRFFAHGFTPAQQVLLVRYTRILLPAQFFFFAGGLFGAAQMARGRHALYAVAALIYNGGIIAGGLLAGVRHGMDGFCWGALAGAFLGHGVLQAAGALRVGMRYRPRLQVRHPAVRQYVLLTLPFMIGQSILVTDDWLVRYFGSALPEASISWLNYAKKLALVLPAILGQASAVAAFPSLSRQAASGGLREMTATLGEGLSRALLLSGLGAALLIVLNREAAFLVFGRGRFTVSDALTTGRALAILALAVPAWVGQAILARGYYALKDTLTPTVIGTVLTAAGVPLYGWLARTFEARWGGGYLGLAAASATSVLVYGIALHAGLAWKLRRADPGAPGILRRTFVPRALVLVFVCLLAGALARGATGTFWPDLTFAQSLLRAALVTGVTAGVYALVARALGLAPEAGLQGLRMRLRQRRA